MIERIKLAFVKWLNGVLSYIISWLGLRMFYEFHFVKDEDDKVQALLFTNDSRLTMIIKDEGREIIELVDRLQAHVEQLEEILVQKGVVLEYEEVGTNQEE